MNDYNQYFDYANKICIKVGLFLKKDFGKTFELTHKSDSHYGIENDIKANKMYEEFLRSVTPEFSLFTEEGERNLDSDFVWVVDPIEGTSNYRTGNPFWATTICLIKQNEPQLSIVYAPVLNQTFYAIKGHGAYLNSNKINVTKLEKLQYALIDIGRGTKDEDKEWYVQTLSQLKNKIRTNRTFGACGLDTSYCAAGITDVYINSGSEVYDYLAGSLIVTEAGGVVVNFKGQKWTLKDKDFLSSNKKLTNDILKVINNHDK